MPTNPQRSLDFETRRASALDRIAEYDAKNLGTARYILADPSKVR
jgi:hypothetical protein